MVKNFFCFIGISLLASYVISLIIYVSPDATLSITRESVDVLVTYLFIGLAIFSSIIFLLAVIFNFKSGCFVFDTTFEEIYLFNIIREWASSKSRKIIIWSVYLIIYSLFSYYIFNVGALLISFSHYFWSMSMIFKRIVWLTIVYVLVAMFMPINVPLIATFKKNSR